MLLCDWGLRRCGRSEMNKRLCCYTNSKCGNFEGHYSIWGGKKMCLEESLLGKNYLGTTSKLFFLSLPSQIVPAYYPQGLLSAGSRCLHTRPTVGLVVSGGRQHRSDHHPDLPFWFFF